MSCCPPRLLALSLLTATTSWAQSVPALPTGFVDEIVAANTPSVIDLDFLPDGRLLFVEQTGRVGLVVPGVGLATVGTVPDLAISYSRGLLAVAVDPHWPHRPFFYAWHTHAPTQSLRLTRYRGVGTLTGAASTNLQMADPYVVLSVPDADPQHNGGFVAFDGEGMLYLSTGDDKQNCDAQDLASYNGKVLRLAVAGLPATGSGPATVAQLTPPNPPFPGAPLVWALGLRNPFRGHADPLQPGRLVVADVGEAAFDELDVVAGGGANLGWPWFEAHQAFQSCAGSAPAQTAPVFTVPIPSGTFVALTSLGIYRNRAGAASNFGPAYEGDVLCVDHFAGEVYRLQESAGAWSTAAPVPGQPSPQHWATGLRYAVAAAVGPDGALYWAERRNASTGAIHRIRPTAAGPSFGFLGAGCTPGVVTASVPRLGQPLSIDVAGLPAATAFAALALGFDEVNSALGPLPFELSGFGVEGCWLRLDPADTLPLTPAAGVWNWTTNVPADAALSGLRFFVQGVALVPGSATTTGFALTAAAGGVLGV